MVDPDDMQAKLSRASELVAEKIGPRGPDLKRQVKRAGRRLPRAVRHDLLVLAHAADLVAHPRLRAQGNADTIGQAFTRATEHLEAIDPADRRRGALLSWLAANALNLIAIFVIVVLVLRWRGLL